MPVQVKVRALPQSQLAAQAARVVIFAALSALGARVQVHLPFTPVPITGQVFCVLLAGGLLGARLGFLSQLAYLSAGAAGLPVFANGGGLAWATSGYLVAFPFAAFVMGLVVEGVRFRGAALAGGLLGVLVVYVLGASWYAVWALTINKTAGLTTVLAQSVYPFVVVDAVKAALAATIIESARRR